MLGLGLNVGLWSRAAEATWRGGIVPFKIELDGSGGSATLALSTLYSYAIGIDWGDGQTEEYQGVGAPITHTFTPAGIYTVTVTPRTFYGFPALRYNNANNRTLVRKIVQWGNSGWRSFGQAFWGCTNMVETATDGADARTEEVWSISQQCVACASLTSWGLSNFPKATAINSAFNGCTSLVNVPAMRLGSASGLGSFLMNGTKVVTPPLWDVRNCSTFTSMFDGCNQATSFPEVQLGNGGSFVNCMRNMSSLNGFDPPFLLNLRKMTNGTQFFQGSKISTAAWSALLVDLAANNPNNNVPFHGGTSTRDAAGDAARTALMARGWTITDGGLAP